MTQEAERYAQESLNCQKQLADSEQNREEFKIQAQETIKQLILFLWFLEIYFFFRWKAKVKKLEKDVDRHKYGSTQVLERNEQLVKDMETFKAQNITLREQVSKLEADLNEAQVYIPFLTFYKYSLCSLPTILRNQLESSILLLINKKKLYR